MGFGIQRHLVWSCGKGVSSSRSIVCATRMEHHHGIASAVDCMVGRSNYQFTSDSRSANLHRTMIHVDGLVLLDITQSIII